MDNFYVINRSGENECLDISKIQTKIVDLANKDPAIVIDTGLITVQTVKLFPSTSITSSEIDEISAKVCEKMFIDTGLNMDYETMAARILTNNHHKNTLDNFVDKMNLLNHQERVVFTADGERKENVKLLSGDFIYAVNKYRDEIDKKIDYERDFLLTTSGIKVLLKTYLLRDINGVVVERWQDAIMRVAFGIHLDNLDDNIDDIFSLYDNMSNLLCTHATPTIFNAGLINGQLSSCFLMGSEDSLTGIMKAASDAAQISKCAGGIGLHNLWRSAGSYISTTNGKTNGKIPFYQIMSSVSRAVDQGGSKRKGSYALYEPIHDAEVINFLNIRSITGENKDKVLFIAVWISDLFMERVKRGEKWSLFSADECPSLYTTWGEQYEKIYIECEKVPGLVRQTVDARELFRTICILQNESGMPYILYGDSANRYSNQQNIGTIRSSNLCAEIIMYSDEKEYGVCNLASICLGRYFENEKFNYAKLAKTTQLLVRTLNSVIDNNYYPVPETQYSNMKNRPIGIGVQGFANVLALMNTTFESDKAEIVNKKIFETIYYAAVSESCELARKNEKKIKKIHRESETKEDLPPYVGAYKTFVGSPLQLGKFRWQLSFGKEDKLVMKYDWEGLMQKIQRYGIANSLMVALMPTASTSLIMNQIESFEPFKTNLHLRNVNAGSMYCYNEYMIKEFRDLGILNSDLAQHIMANSGSVQKIDGLSEELKYKYKTAYELDQMKLLKLAIARQHFVDQSQSFNWFMERGLSFNDFKKYQFAAWRGGMITGSYYTHQLPVSEAFKFTLNLKNINSYVIPNEPMDNDDEDGSEMCLSCGS